MKVLICAPYYPPYIRGGGEISTELLVKALQGAGVTVEVLTAFRSNLTEEINRVTVHRVTSPNIYWSFDSRKKAAWKKTLWHLREGYGGFKSRGITRVIEEFQPDVLHTSGIEDISPKIWPLARRMGIPTVHTLRSFTLLCRSATLRKGDINCDTRCLSCAVFSAPKRSLSASVDAVIGISRFILDRHLQLGFFANADRYVVRNIAVDETSGESGRREPRSGPLAIGFLGRLSPEKGVERTFAALRRLPRETRPTFWIAGWGDDAYVAELKENAAGIDAQFMGKVPAGELFSRIDLLVVPSLWHEPLGRIVLEANAYGLPVLAARRGGIPEIVQEGSTGWLFEPDHPDELAAWLEKLVADPSLARSRQAACRKVSQEYAGESIVHEHLKIYERAVTRKQPGSLLVAGQPPNSAGKF